MPYVNIKVTREGVAAVIVGEAVDLIRSREPAQATLHRMISQAEHRLRRVGQLVEPITKD